MTDKEILDEVYAALKAERAKYDSQPQGWLFGDPLINFIEREWQKEDEKELVAQYNRNRNPKDWIIDVREMERHRGLEIGPDGTVKSLD